MLSIEFVVKKVSAKLATRQSESLNGFWFLESASNVVGTLSTDDRMLHTGRLRMKSPSARAQISELREKHSSTSELHEKDTTATEASKHSSSSASHEPMTQLVLNGSRAHACPAGSSSLSISAHFALRKVRVRELTVKERCPVC